MPTPEHARPCRVAMAEYAPKSLATGDLLGRRVLHKQQLADELMQARGLSRGGAYSAIQMAHDLGVIERVRRGVYRRSERYAP